MKILIYSINYSPEFVGIGKYNGEMVEWLIKKGHQVRVITSPPYYPNWRVWPNYLQLHYKIESNFNGKCKIFRCPIYVPKNPGTLPRIVYLLSFFISSLPVMFAHILWRPNIIFLTEPPIICSPIALLVGWFSNSKSILHVHDFEIDAAFNLELLRGNLIRKTLQIFEKLIMNSFAVVSTISSRMQNILMKKGVSAKKIKIMRNWVNLELISPNKITPFSKIELKKIYGVPKKHLIAFYSGNMGNKQGFEILADVAKAAINDNIFFIFSGDGPARQEFENQCKGLPNVKFLSLQKEEAFVQLLWLADIHLLPQKLGVTDLVMPSKLTGMLASGRPIIASAEAGSEVASIVSLCGIVVPSGNSSKFYEALSFLARSNEHRLKLGKIARIYAERELDKEVILGNFFDAI
jgi:colanic acid biosynthesis glycosyl transferase WcaI